jgi:peptidoglycan/LPS O-acetylase OafA/YrhL
MDEPRNRTLDTLRGFAVLMVIAVHVGQSFEPVSGPIGEFAASFGLFGVQLFFVVSGYTMMLTFGERITTDRVRSFYIRRVFRLVPPFWAAGALYLLLDGTGPRYWAPAGLSLSDMLLTFTMLHWASPTAFNSVVPGGWSIAVEMQFYLLFPFLFWLVTRRYGPLMLAVTIASVYVLAMAASKWLFLPMMTAALPGDAKYLADSFFYFWLPRQLVCFGFGMLLHQEIAGRRPGWLAFALLAGACLPTAWGRQVLFLAMLAFFVLRTGSETKAMSSIGENSYSMYLTHFAVIAFASAAIKRLTPGGLPFELAFPLVVSASYAVSRWVAKPFIENPGQRAGKAVIKRAREPLRRRAAAPE